MDTLPYKNPPQRPTRGYGLFEGYLALLRAKMAHKLIPVNGKKERVLDIGCGVTPYFLLHADFKEKYGIEQTCGVGYPDNGIRFTAQDIQKKEPLPFDDNFFDVVTMLAVFEHLELDCLVQTLAEIHRVLKPAGRLILTTPAPRASGLLKIMARLKLVSSEEISEHKGTYSQKIIMKYIRAGGFSSENIRCGTFEFGFNVWACADK